MEEQPFHRNLLRFRGGLVFKAHGLCVSLNSRLESNEEEEDIAEGLIGAGRETPTCCSKEHTHITVHQEVVWREPLSSDERKTQKASRSSEERIPEMLIYIIYIYDESVGVADGDLVEEPARFA